MKNSTLLIIGVGVPSELTEVLAKAGCEVQRSDSPLAAAIALVRGDVDLVLMVGPQDESWNDFTDAISSVTQACGNFCDFRWRSIDFTAT